jgi:hypothetical protein
MQNIAYQRERICGACYSTHFPLQLGKSRSAEHNQRVKFVTLRRFPLVETGNALVTEIFPNFAFTCLFGKKQTTAALTLTH